MTDFSELHAELRTVAADVLGRHIGGPLSQASIAELGWSGLEVDEDLGGAGASFREVAIVCEQIGQAVGSTGYLGSTVLGVGLLNSLRPGGIRDELLSGIAEGTATVAVVIGTEGTAPGRIGFDGAPVDGRVDLVPDAGGADTVLVPTVDADGRSVVVALGRETPGLTLAERPVIDETRCLADVVADSITVPGSAVLEYADDADPDVTRARALAAVALDSLGVAAAMLDATVEYVSMRHQFGRPIGSFQAVKHACADMAVQIAVSRQLVGIAVAAIADGTAEAHRASVMAKAYASEAAVAVAGKAMQLHGGIGYTWEADVHRYLKRATLNRALFGTPMQLRGELTRSASR